MNKQTCTLCGKKFINVYHLQRHAEVMHKEERKTEVMHKEERKTEQDKRKGWCTPHGFVDFREPVTYAEALAVAEAYSKKLGERHE